MWVRLAIYVGGLALLTLGIDIAILSNLGTRPWDGMFAGFSYKFGLTLGVWSIIIQAVLVLVASVVSRTRPMFECFITIAVRGFLLDFWLIYVFADIVIPETELAVRWVLFSLGTVLMGLGLGTYIISKFPPTPIDLLVFAIAERFKLTQRNSRTFVELFALIVGFFMGGAIGVGTVIIVFSIGYIVQFSNELAKKWLKVF